MAGPSSTTFALSREMLLMFDTILLRSCPELLAAMRAEDKRRRTISQNHVVAREYSGHRLTFPFLGVDRKFYGTNENH
jgi:hypothetical protein